MSKRSDKIAIVTGGTGALGRIVVERLLQTGANVIVTHTGNAASSDYILSLQNRGLNIEGSIVDVTSDNSVDSFYTEIIKKYNRIDILCNLVGAVSSKKNIEDISLDDWNAMLNVNLQSCFLMIKNSIRAMKKNGFGRIISIAAMPGVTPEAKRGGYGVAKAGIIALTKTVAEEIKEFGNITINAIAPSIIVTDENRKWGTEEEIKKWVTPEQIADMIVYLCSESGTAFNGQILQMYGKV